MRKRNRIDRIVAKLRAYWHAHPDLRLGQIVGNMADSYSGAVRHADFSRVVDPYYFEDDKLEAELDRALQEPEHDPHYLLG